MDINGWWIDRKREKDYLKKRWYKQIKMGSLHEILKVSEQLYFCLNLTYEEDVEGKDETIAEL